jgi:hypothetical protein
LSQLHKLPRPKGQSRTEPTAPPAAQLDVRTLMSQKAFKETGLSKLEEAELDALNQWLTALAVQLLAEKQSRAGCQEPIESNIDGDFEGWDGDTVFTLRNGQIWKQTTYGYTYHYAFSPSVLIYKAGTGCKLRVDGADGAIGVERLK